MKIGNGQPGKNWGGRAIPRMRLIVKYQLTEGCVGAVDNEGSPGGPGGVGGGVEEVEGTEGHPGPQGLGDRGQGPWIDRGGWAMRPCAPSGEGVAGCRDL